MNKLKGKTISSLIWKLFEKVGAQVITFSITIILARLLTPEEYGAVALMTVFIAISKVFIESGFSRALIQKKNITDEDACSVFYFSVALAVTIYLIIFFFVAPAAADFYKIEVIENALRVLSLLLLTGTYNSMQSTMLQKKLLFKRLFISTYSSIIVGGIIGIFMAYNGFGVWSLVFQQLSTSVMKSVILTFTVGWRPKLIFSMDSLKELFPFASKLFMSSIIQTLYQNIYSLIIGGVYSVTDLAYWNKGKRFPNLLIIDVNGTISTVMYPVMAKVQDDKKVLKSITSRSIKTSSYLVFPLMMGLAICAEPIVRLLLTDKWLLCVPFLQGWCFVYAWMPIHTANLQGYKAMGRSDVFLRLEVIKKIIGITILVVTLPFGLWAMMSGKFLSCIISGVINSFPNKRLLNYGYFEQLKDLLPGMLLSVFMGICVYLISLINLNYILLLVIQVISGVLIYVAGSIIFKIQSFNYILDIIKDMIKKRKTVI